MISTTRGKSSGFYGRYRRTRQVGSMQVADLDATVPPQDVHEHSHDDAHFVLVLQGRYMSSAREMPDVSDGLALIFNPPGTTHRDRFETASGRFVAISLPAGEWQDVEGCAVSARGPRRQSIRSIVAAVRIAAELRRWDRSSSLAVEAGCAELLGDAAEARDQPSAWPRWLDRMVERLQAELAETPALASLADDVGVHPVYLSRAFRRHLGCTPGDYLRRKRLEFAAALLAREHTSLSDVAQQAGFFDQSHLHRSLRQAVGLSPMALRRLIEAAV